MAAWLLSGGNIAVRLGEPYVVPYALLMFVLAWLGTVGAAISAWRLIRQWKQLGAWKRVAGTLTTCAAVLLALFCVIWRVAGTNVNF
jgi:hypothetical protein